jgi:hypothetical protein
MLILPKCYNKNNSSAKPSCGSVTYFFSFSIRQHSFERQTRFQMSPFIVSLILYFFIGGCTSLVSLDSLPSPSPLLSTSIVVPSSPGGKGAALEAGEPSTEAVPAAPSPFVFSCFFSAKKPSISQTHVSMQYLPHAVTLRSHSSFACGNPLSAADLSSASNSSCRFTRSAMCSGKICRLINFCTPPM